MFTVNQAGAVAIVTLHRPEARNAIAVRHWDALAEIAAGLATSDARAVILASGVAGVFSAGADIGEFAGLQADPGARPAFRHAMRRGIDAVAALPMPVIAAVDGGAYGAAVALTLACDMRVAGDGARFAVTPAKLGIGYPREDLARLAALVGRGQAARMVFAAQTIDAGEALAIGLAEVRAPDAAKAAQAIAERIAGHAPDAVRLLKRTLDGPGDAPGDAALDQAFDDAFGGPALMAGLASLRRR